MTSEVDVVIVGAGPVAMIHALLLARFGVSSVMLEAKAQRDPIGSRALCMQRDVLDILDRVEVAEHLVREGVTWTKGRTYFGDIELFQITFHDAGRSHFPPFVNIGQDRTESWLEEAVGSEPLTEIRYGHEVIGIEQSDDGVTVRAATSGGEVELDGRYAVGADGARSRARALLGVDFPGFSFDDQFLICDISARLPFSNERRFFFDPEWNPDRQVLIHPQADSVWRIDWQVPPDFALEDEEASGRLDDRIRKIVGDQDYEVLWRSVYRFHQRVAERFRVGRTFLAGDASHVAAPFGARGLNSGIQDADNLAWKLAYVLKGWAPDALLDTYDQERRAAAIENDRVTAATMRFLVPQSAVEWEHRRSVLRRAAAEEAAAALVDSGKLAEPYWYLDSPLTTPPEHPVDFPTEAGIPRSVVPGVLCPDGPVAVAGRPAIIRLRQLLGKAFVVLTQKVPCDFGDQPAPVDTYDLATIDTEGVISKALTLEDHRAAVIRPDGHIAAIVDAAEVHGAINRALGVARP